MFRILIVPANSSANAIMFYKSRASAENAQKNIHEMQKGTIDCHVMTIKDDIGHILTIDRKNISYALFIDMEKSYPYIQQQGKEIGNAKA